MQARLITEIGTMTVLRRYVSAIDADTTCPLSPGGSGYHDAAVVAERTLGPVPEVLHGYSLNPNRGYVSPEAAAFVGDSRWPVACKCGYIFTPDDEWQVATKRLYDTPSGRPETGDLYWGDWGLSKHTHGYTTGERHLHAVTPAGDLWDVDGPSINNGSFGEGWTWHGTPPLITVTPSIKTARYHGFLANGVWTPDIDAGRTYAHRVIEHA